MSNLEKAELRDLKKEDLPLVLKWRNQNSIRQFMYNSELISMDQHMEWFQRLSTSTTSKTKIFFYENRAVGVLNINNINQQYGRCEWGFYIGDLSGPKGIGAIMGYMSLEYIFQFLNMRKVCAEVIGFNQKSLSFHEKLGFIKEGCLRKHIIKNGKEEDVYIFGLMKNEWNAVSPKIKKKMEG